MSDERPSTELWRVFRLFLVSLNDGGLDAVSKQFRKEVIARDERDTSAVRLLFSSLSADDLASAGRQIAAEQSARAVDRQKLACVLEPGPENSRWISGEETANEPPGGAQESSFLGQNALACCGLPSDECDDRGRRRRHKETSQNMTCFTINEHDNITAFTTTEEAARSGGSQATVFASQAELAKTSADWPMSRLIEIYNSIPGHSPVQRFADRKKAVARIWAAIQPLAGPAPESAPVEESRGRKVAKTKKSQKSAAKTTPRTKPAKGSPAASSKKAAVITMLKRGTTLSKIMSATGWQAHTVRGLISILGSKGGIRIDSSKNSSGERSYRIAE